MLIISRVCTSLSVLEIPLIVRVGLDALRDPNWDGDYDEDERDIVWGDFSHDLRCIDVDCDVCYSNKMRKYCPWW